MKERKIFRIPEIPTDKVMLLNLTGRYKAEKKENPDMEPDIYELARKNWNADKDRSKDADYILALNNGVVVGIFNNAVWSYMDYRGYQRVGFVGDEVKDSPYLGLDLSTYLRIQNPIRYVNF